jgi:hypothetical protein
MVIDDGRRKVSQVPPLSQKVPEPFRGVPGYPYEVASISGFWGDKGIAIPIAAILGR